MPGDLRDRLERYGGLLGVVLVVLVVIAVAVVIAGHNGTSGSSFAENPPAPRSLPTAAPAGSVQPTALLTGAAASFDSSLGGWKGDGATLSQATTVIERGRSALAVASTGTVATVWSPQEHAVGGDRYVGSADIRAATVPTGALAELRFIDASGAVTDTEPGQQATTSMTAWTDLPDVAAIAPKGTVGVQLGVAMPATAAGGVQAVDDASLQQTPGGSTSVIGPLTARGSQIIQGNGRPVTLRGLGRFGLEGGTKTPLPTDAEIGQLKGWGANVVRISLGEQKWLPTSCDYEADYPQVVDQVVRWVTSRGMVALLNLHFSQLGDCGTPGLTPMADSPGSVTFWQEVANRYQHNPLVAFDLFNEPHVPQSVWLDGGTFQLDNQTVQAAGMQELYDTVRGTGATNLVVVSGLDYADHPPTELVNGTNLAYGAHAYTCPNFPPPQCTAPHPYDAAVPLHHWLTFAKTHVVMVTEFGWPNGDDGTYNANVIAYAEEQHWSWMGFAWDGGTDGLFDLVQAHPASDGTTIEPNSGGMPLVAGFARNTLVASH